MPSSLHQHHVNADTSSCHNFGRKKRRGVSFCLSWQALLGNAGNNCLVSSSSSSFFSTFFSWFLMHFSMMQMIEKKRRDRINNSLNDLRRLVPAAFEKQGSAKLEKAEILQMTVDHLTMLHAKGKLSYHFLFFKRHLYFSSTSNNKTVMRWWSEKTFKLYPTIYTLMMMVVMMILKTRKTQEKRLSTS